MGCILLVTASKSLSDVVTKVFEGHGLSVLSVDSIEACAQALIVQPGRFDHVVLDAVLTRGIRTGELVNIHASGVPLLVLASETHLHRLRRLFPTETTDFLEKPFRPSQLLTLTKRRSSA